MTFHCLAYFLTCPCNVRFCPYAYKLPICRPSWLVRVRGAQLHLSIWGHGCMHPSIFRPNTTFRLFFLIFPANGRILHPSIEKSNQGTVMYSACARGGARGAMAFPGISRIMYFYLISPLERRIIWHIHGFYYVCPPLNWNPYAGADVWTSP